MNPSNNTMKAAPRREPASIAKVSDGFNTLASNKLSAVAATGEPERAKLAPNQPNPKALAVEFTENTPRMSVSIGLAPSFISNKANTKKDIHILIPARLKTRRVIFTIIKVLYPRLFLPISHQFMVSFHPCQSYIPPIRQIQ